jgi:hypothetical protein
MALRMTIVVCSLPAVAFWVAGILSLTLPAHVNLVKLFALVFAGSFAVIWFLLGMLEACQGRTSCWCEQLEHKAVRAHPGCRANASPTQAAQRKQRPRGCGGKSIPRPLPMPLLLIIMVPEAIALWVAGVLTLSLRDGNFQLLLAIVFAGSLVMFVCLMGYLDFWREQLVARAQPLCEKDEIVREDSWRSARGRDEKRWKLKIEISVSRTSSSGGRTSSGGDPEAAAQRPPSLMDKYLMKRISKFGGSTTDLKETARRMRQVRREAKSLIICNSH